MSKLLARRHRILRARHVQHSVAVAETVRARDEANAIHHNSERLKRVRAELFKGGENHVLGGSFAAYRELADRLEKAGKQLEGALYDANRKVSEKDEKRIEANRDREIAEIGRAHV
jgi:phosphopantothenate synthetase